MLLTTAMSMTTMVGDKNNNMVLMTKPLVIMIVNNEDDDAQCYNASVVAAEMNLMTILTKGGTRIMLTLKITYFWVPIAHFQ